MAVRDRRAKTWTHRILLGAGLCWASFAAAAFEVSLTGPEREELRDTLSGASLLVEAADDEEQISVQEIITTAQADYKRLLAVLYDRGFFGPTIRITLDGREASDMNPVSPPRAVRQVRISVTEGKRFKFGRAEVSPLNAQTELPESFRLGERATLSAMKDATQVAIDGWRADGHAKAVVADQQITANHSASEINARVRIAPGPRLRFGPLKVAGNKAVRTDRIREIAGLPEGKDFSPDEMADSAARLRRTGAFRSVAMIEADTIAANNTLPITARVVEEKPRRFGFGAEVATIDGVTLSGFWLHRNFFGGAERLRVDAEIAGIGGDTGGVDYKLGARFERPATFNEDTNFFALAEVEQLDQVGFFSRQVTLGVGIERFASDERTYSFGTGIRRANTRDAFGEDDYTLLLFPAAATFDYRDFELDARSGYYARADLTPFLTVSGADNGVLSKLDYRRYFSFGEESPTTFALRAQIKSLVGPSLDDAPADFLFYSGGGGTVRGHEFQSLGIDVGGDDEIGGRSFLGLSAEARFRTSGSLGYVAFFDAGYIGRESFPDGSGEWHSGAGLGVRYATGIGPIRVDFAVPVSGDDEDSAFQIYIGIGHSF